MSRSFTITVHLEELPVEIQIEAESSMDWYVNDVTANGLQLPWQKMHIRNAKGILMPFDSFFYKEIEDAVRDQFCGKYVRTLQHFGGVMVQA